MVAGAHAHKFFKEVASTNSVWTLGHGESPVFIESSGTRVQPLWSSRKRVEKIVATAKGYEKCTILGMDWSQFESMWIEHLSKEGVLLGINWSGPNANGYEMLPRLVAESVRAARNAAA